MKAENPDIVAQIQDLERRLGPNEYRVTRSEPGDQIEHTVPGVKSPDQAELITKKSQLKIDALPLRQNQPTDDPKIFIFRANLLNGIAVILKEYISADQNKVIKEGGKEAEIMRNMSGDLNFIEYFGCYDEYKENKYYFGVVMEQCTTDLMTYIKQTPSPVFEQLQLQTMTRELIHAFENMHSKGFFHLDIKPHNIFINDGILKIADFNVSGIRESAPVATTTCAQNHPAQGTEGFMAPELQVHFDKRKIDIKYPMNNIEYIRDRADVYSLGVTFLRMYTCDDITGVNTEGGQEKLQKILAGVQYEWLKNLLMRMLEFDFNKRPKMRDLIELLPPVDETERPTTSFLRE